MFRLKRVTPLFALLLMTVLSGVHADDKKEIKLFNENDLSGWGHFLTKPVKREEVWSVKNGILICKGTPGGYLATKKKYTNFKLVVEWRWPKKPGNSGVLMRITGKPTMLPNCVEAQLQHQNAGDMYGFQGFKIDGDKSRKSANPNVLGGLTSVKKIMRNEKKPGEWNKYEITANGGKITVMLNGKKVNEATGCDVRAGQIGLQSEGGEVHFRTVQLTPIK